MTSEFIKPGLLRTVRNVQESDTNFVSWWNHYKTTYQIAKCGKKLIETTQYYPVMTLKDQAKFAEQQRKDNLAAQRRFIRTIKIKEKYKNKGGNFWGGVTITQLCNQVNELRREAKKIPVLTG